MTAENFRTRRRRRKCFFCVSFADGAGHNGRVIGAYLNALGILLGALAGLAWRGGFSLRTQNFLKSALGAFTAFFGLRLVWENIGGSFPACGRQLALALLAVILGNWLGRLMGLQKISNRLGHQAAGVLAAAQKNPPGRTGDGLAAVTVLFCAAPLGLAGAVTDGLADFFQLLAVKAVMDGLAMMSFVKLFRWPVALAALPVFIFVNALSFAVRLGARPWLEAHALAGAVGVTAGLLACTLALVILELRRVELANYLPALAVAPLLAWLLV